MGVEETVSPQYGFTCDACNAETATGSTPIAPDGWHQLSTGADVALIGPLCSDAGITVVYSGDGWQIARR